MSRLCPRDGSGLVEKRIEADIPVDVCPTCNGKWLDHGELEAIEESHEKHHAGELEKMGLDLLPRGEGIRPFGDQVAKCPVCASEMSVEEYVHTSLINIDVCPKGCGVWLDDGELRQIELFFEKNRARAKSEDEALWVVRGFWASLRGFFKSKT